MRDLALALGMLFFVPASLLRPAAGLLCWEWFSIMSPHREVYGFTAGQPLNGVIAVATLAGWLLSRERKRWTPDLLPWVMLALIGWMMVNMLVVPYPDYAWPYGIRVLRTMVPVFLAFVLLTTKARIHAMVWIIVISLGYYGVRGGAFTIVTGGGGIVYGPPDTVLADNNQLALGIVMALPLGVYLLRQSSWRLLRVGLAIAIPLEVIMVFGSFSRGGVISLALTLVVFWWRSKRKVLYATAGLAVIAAGLSVMPDSFWTRMDTLNNVGADASFEGRVMAWHVALYYAIDHFPFGAGFYTPQLASIFGRYFPDAAPHAAHSIYFQILGEHGFAGFALYVAMLLLGLRNAGIVMRQTKDRPEVAWARDLADMVRVSLIGFYVGGAALSVAYFDGYMILLAVTSTLREMTRPPPADAAAAADARAPALAAVG